MTDMTEMTEIKKVRPSREKDYQSAYYKSWYQKNKKTHIENVKRNKQNRPKVYIDCGCGSRIQKDCMRDHVVTKKHSLYLKEESAKEE